MENEINSGALLIDQKRNTVNFSVFFSIFILIAVIIFFYFWAFIPIDGVSMENTFHDKHYCFVQRKCFDIDRGDVITINTAKANEKEHILIKRVVATGGDKLLFMVSEDSTPQKKYFDLYLMKAGEHSFTRVDEPYIKERMLFVNSNHDVNGDPQIEPIPYNKYLSSLDYFAPENVLYFSAISKNIVQIPDNYLYFLGDNRNVSRDSRYYGPLSMDAVTSKVLLEV